MVKGSINPPSPTPVITFNIGVSVNDGTDPLGNVDVVLTDTENNEYSGKTGSAGGCTISNVPEGTYNVTATKTGYNTYNGTITVNEANTSLSISMTEE